MGQFTANGSLSDNLVFADRDKEGSFTYSSTSGPVHNQIAADIETALGCMLGHMAGFQKGEVTWEERLSHSESYNLGIDLNKLA